MNGPVGGWRKVSLIRKKEEKKKFSRHPRWTIAVAEWAPCQCQVAFVKT